MSIQQLIKTAGAAAALAVLAVTATLVTSTRGYAGEHGDDNNGDDQESKVERGLDIAPVPLNMGGKNRELVGLGSYIVNAQADCDACHSAGPATQYAPGGNPFFKGNPPAVLNQATYLGGSRIFPSQIPGVTPPIVSRNLTPDKTGRPEGGRTFEEFRLIMQTGADLDHVHPNCSDPTITTSSTCFPVGVRFNGDVLQIMPWPLFQNMTEHDLRAIYEYLSAIPCITGPPTGVLHNDCT